MEEVNIIFSHGALMCNNGRFLHIWGGCGELLRQGRNLRLGFLQSHICQHIEMVKSFGAQMCNKHSMRDPRSRIECGTFLYFYNCFSKYVTPLY